MEALVFFGKKLDALRLSGTLSIHVMRGEEGSRTMIGAGRYAGHDGKRVSVTSNATAVLDAIGYCRAAVEELEAMKLTPQCDVARIEILKMGIPSDQSFELVAADVPEGVRAPVLVA